MAGRYLGVIRSGLVLLSLSGLEMASMDQI